jgi:hypothetical protein
MSNDRVDALIHRASCACGQLTIDCTGAPVRVSVCHCLDCQRRSGSAFAVQARFPADRVTVTGQSKQWTRIADSGGHSVNNFCPDCGSTLFYSSRPHRDLVAVPVGAFADPNFPPPGFSVYEKRKHGWIAIAGDGVEHHE